MLRTIVFDSPVAVSTVVIYFSWPRLPANSSLLLFEARQKCSRNVSIAFGRKIAPQRVSFPIGGKENSPQIGVPIEANAHQIENFALQPARSRPYRNKGINHRVRAADPRAQTNFGFLRNGNQMVIQLEARLGRKAVE